MLKTRWETWREESVSFRSVVSWPLWLICDEPFLSEEGDARPLTDPRRVWEAIAPEFSRTRPEPWPEVVAWAENHLKPGARVLDVGAGNGRHGIAFRACGFRPVAVDFARPFVEEIRRRGIPGVAADARFLPFRDESFDGAAFIASLHNIPGEDDRAHALAEVARVLKPGSRALVTVWLRDGETGDVEVPWRGRVPRYYHFYTPEALRADAEAAGFEVASLRPLRALGDGPADNLFLEVAKREVF